MSIENKIDNLTAAIERLTLVLEGRHKADAPGAAPEAEKQSSAPVVAPAKPESKKASAKKAPVIKATEVAEVLEKEEAAEAEAPTYTYDQVSAAVVDAAAKGKRSAVVDLLKQYGATGADGKINARNLGKESYASFMIDLKAIAEEVA